MLQELRQLAEACQAMLVQKIATLTLKTNLSAWKLLQATVNLQQPDIYLWWLLFTDRQVPASLSVWWWYITWVGAFVAMLCTKIFDFCK